MLMLARKRKGDLALPRSITLLRLANVDVGPFALVTEADIGCNELVAGGLQLLHGRRNQFEGSCDVRG